jgi:Tfp pilus assembly protein PilX
MIGRIYRHQRGVTLLVSLVMLVVLTIFAISSFNLSSINLRISGNFQQQRFMEATAQQALDQVISTNSAFNLTPSPQTLTVNGYAVSVSAPVCNYTKTATGYEKKEGDTLAPEDTEWEVRATATDTTSGAKATVTQGLRIRLLGGNCPN